VIDPIELTFKFDYIVSVNAMYEPNLSYRTFGGRKYPIYKGKRLSDHAREFKQSIKLQMESYGVDPEVVKSTMDWNYGLDFQSVCVFKQSFLKRDLDNTLKCLIDGIFEYLGLNDSRVLDNRNKKLFCPQASVEYLKVRLEQTKEPLDNYRI